MATQYFAFHLRNSSARAQQWTLSPASHKIVCTLFNHSKTDFLHLHDGEEKVLVHIIVGRNKWNKVHEMV